MTSGHVDGYVLFKAQSAVLVEVIDDRQVEPPLWHSKDIKTLEQAKDAADKMFNVERIPRGLASRFAPANTTRME